jgi:ATP-binding cassette subfamily B protein
VLLVAEGVATVVRDHYFNLAAERVTTRLRQRVFDHLLSQEIAFFDSRNVGELTTRLSDDVAVINRVLGDKLADAVRSVLVGVLGTVLLVYTSPILTLLLMLAVPPIAVMAWVLGGRVKTLSAGTQQAYADAGVIVEESLTGIRTVRAFSQETSQRLRYRDKLQTGVELARRRILANSTRSGVSFLAGEGAALFGLWAGANLIIENRLTSGAVISFVLYGLQIACGLRSASDFWGEAVRGLGATQWIFEMLAREPQLPVDGGVQPARVEGAVTLDRVHSVSGPAGRRTLAGVDLSIRPGEVVALVGRSGAGKSTILNLLLRFYDPDGAGSGRWARYTNPRRDVAAVPDRCGHARADAVLEALPNIRYGLVTRSDSEVAAAAELANARASAFPGRFATTIGTRGVQLSGGQRRRLAIARGPAPTGILILDEATNTLDSESEAFVHKALHALDYARRH